MQGATDTFRSLKSNPIVRQSKLWWNAHQDYTATKFDRYSRDQSHLPHNGASADYHSRSEHLRLRLIEMSRDYEMNDPIVRAGINRLISNIIQAGFIPEPRTGDKEVNKKLKKLWKRWSDTPTRCDAAHRMTFRQMEQLALRAIIRDGDVFAVRTNSGKLRWYEGHRYRTPGDKADTTVLGITLDPAFRVPKTAWFTKEEINPYKQLQSTTKLTGIDFDDPKSSVPKVLHLAFLDRFGQTRGVTALSPISQYIGMLDDLHFAKLVQAQTVSAYSIIKQRDLDEWTSGVPGGGMGGDTETDTTPDGYSRKFELNGPGQIVDGEPGVNYVGFSPHVPNAEFFQHSMQIITFIAANFDLPVFTLLLDSSQTNFSGFRGALDQARLRFRQIQDWFVDTFHKQVWRWQVELWIEEDPELQALVDSMDVDLFACEWITPTWQYLEPLKDTQADVLAVKSNINSPRRIAAGQNRRWEELKDEIIEDNISLIEPAMEAAVALNKKFKGTGQQVTWREVATLPLPDGIVLNMDAGLSDEPTPEEKKKNEQPNPNNS